MTTSLTQGATFVLFSELEQCAALDIEQKSENKLIPLNLVELFRVRAKASNESKLIASKGKSYSSFWNYLLEEKFPHFQTSGKLHLDIQEKLSLLIGAYLQKESDPKAAHLDFYKEQLNKLIITLSHYCADDLKYLYSVSIKTKTRNYYLVEILLDCMQFSEDLSEKLLALAKWQQRYLNEKLFSLAAKGDLDKLQQLINLGAQVETVQGNRILN